MRPKWYNSLRVQVVCLLTLALLPLGTIAIYQTNRVASEAEIKAELALLALTERAAKAEELIIARAIGAARGLAGLASELTASEDACVDYLSTYTTGDSEYSFVAFLPRDGVVTCASDGKTYDFSGWPNFGPLMEAGEQTIVVNTQGPASMQPVFVLSEPYTIDGQFAGLVSFSIPHNTVPQINGEFADLGLMELVIFSDDGVILTAKNGLEAAAEELPANRFLIDLANGPDTSFRGLNESGEERTYTVVAINGSPASILASWSTAGGVASRATDIIKPAVFPILMWFASMLVALMSIYTFVLRHIARLRKDMDNFATHRTVSTNNKPISMPNEFVSLNENFERMTDDILRDEAKLENSVREKNVLIKEVHHRTKNNLQLISSIMNMQIRAAQENETKQVLARLQDRILSLATIHRDLYQSQNGGRVDVGALLREIVEKSVEVATETDSDLVVTKDIDQVLLFPDQAVPLSLLSAEGMTNAMKYLGRDPEGKLWVRASLKRDGLNCTLTLVNSIGDAPMSESTGLGAQLINAFVIQLGAKIDVNHTDEFYEMVVQFKAAEFVPDTPDF